MDNVIQFVPRTADGKRPDDVYFCSQCENTEFLLWADGAILCSKCCEEMPNIKVVEKQ